MPEPENRERNPSQRIGLALKRARIENSFTIDYIEAQLKISRDKVEAIEAGDFSSVGRETFVRGYIARYCRLVNLDLDEVLSDFEMEPPEESDFHVQIMPDRLTFVERVKERAGILLTVITALGVMAVLTTLYFVWTPLENVPSASSPASTDSSDSGLVSSDEGNDIPPQTGEADEIESAETLDTAATDLANEANAESESNETIEPATSDEPAESEVFSSLDTLESAQPLDESNASTSTPVGEQADSEVNSIEGSESDSMEEELPVPDRLQLAFSGRCYAQVIDRTGKTLFIGHSETGESLDLIGEAPFEIELGQAGVVKVTYQGEDIPLEQYTRGGRAKFSVGP